MEANYKEDKQYYVEIGTNSIGEAMVKVSVGSDNPAIVDVAFGLYHDTIETLIENYYPVAAPFIPEIRVTNENSEFSPQVTVSGKGVEVVEEFLKALKKANGEVTEV